MNQSTLPTRPDVAAGATLTIDGITYYPPEPTSVQLVDDEDGADIKD